MPEVTAATVHELTRLAALTRGVTELHIAVASLTVIPVTDTDISSLTVVNSCVQEARLCALRSFLLSNIDHEARLAARLQHR